MSINTVTEAFALDSHKEADWAEQENAARDEALAYIRSKWPEAEWGEVRDGGNVFSVLRAVRQERVCAACLADSRSLAGRGCDRRRKIGMIAREESNGSPRFSVRFRSCPLEAARETDKAPLDRMIGWSRLTQKQQGQTFGAFDHDGISPDVRRAYRQALGAADDGGWLTLGGRRGAGKSHLAAAIALDVMQKKGEQAYFRLVAEMLDDLRRGYDDDTHDKQMRFLKNVPCLILDDLGKEHSTPAACDYLYQIIDSRYREGRQIIVTTNARSKEELASWGDSSFLAPLISRMDEMGDWVFIADAEDYRAKLGRERRANAA